MNQYVEDAKRTEPDYGPVVERLANPETARLLHVAMGLVTEAAEFVDQLKRHLFYGKAVDTTNLLEELGDITWYQRIGVDELHSSLLDILDRNVAKLRKRFPERFTEQAAVNRDLDAERAVLEAVPVQDRERGQGSGPLPGRDVTVVQTPDKTLFLDCQGVSADAGRGKVSLP